MCASFIISGRTIPLLLTVDYSCTECYNRAGYDSICVGQLSVTLMLLYVGVVCVYSNGATEVTYCIVSDEDVDDPTADDKKDAMTTIGRSFIEERTAGSESKPRSVSYPQSFSLHMYKLHILSMY